MRKIIIASDSFKGSLSSAEVAEAASIGINDIYPGCEVIKICMADGGEGMLAALESGISTSRIKAKVHDPIGRLIDSYYLIADDGNTAIIEMAMASGLTLLEADERNPMETSSFGTGELILDAFKRGCRRFIIGIGGSATNDGGCGMLEAMGYRFIDCHGNEITGCRGCMLKQIAAVDCSDVPHDLTDSEFIVACDVETVFCGRNGATNIFARQKGADEEMIPKLEEGMKSFADVIFKETGDRLDTVKGTGAAGGVGGALHAFLHAELKSGADLILDAIGFDEIVKDSDLVITGEGKIDSQTFMGKGPAEIAKRALKYGIDTVAIGGIVETDNDSCFPFKEIIPTGKRPETPAELSDAMDTHTASENIRKTVYEYLKSNSFKKL